ncbi:hypothetical protein AVEN_199050-1 [Araneus ventricosus]|uniref:Mariner Mos1 transposase n=1 Tax=Araneus ventricosus TaxID=182803 RepID=A0A4Y2TR51_ARAVE|nr:hypothetical protein AVEN_199050-1 [Araneus ventricosus]
MRFSQTLKDKRPIYEQRHDKVILQHDIVQPHVAKPVKTYLETLKWEVLLYLPYSPDFGVYPGTPGWVGGFVEFRTLTTEPNPTPNPTGGIRIDSFVSSDYHLL